MSKGVIARAKTEAISRQVETEFKSFSSSLNLYPTPFFGRKLYTFKYNAKKSENYLATP